MIWSLKKVDDCSVDEKRGFTKSAGQFIPSKSDRVFLQTNVGTTGTQTWCTWDKNVIITYLNATICKAEKNGRWHDGGLEAQFRFS